MIKFIATDIDGTLMTSEKTYDRERFARVVRRLQKQGIFVSIASGNQYACMRRRFEPLSKDLFFICDNGALIARGYDVLRYHALPSDTALTVKEILAGHAELKVLASGVHHAHMYAADRTYEQYMSHFFTDFLFDDLETGDDPILKFSMLTPENRAPLCLDALLKELPDTVSAVTSGHNSIDIMPAGCSKGGGIRAFQQLLHLTPDQCMCFGDQMNDCPMFREVTWSYAMANAIPELKAIAMATAPSNDEAGVMAVLERLADGEDMPIRIAVTPPARPAVSP